MQRALRSCFVVVVLSLIVTHPAAHARPVPTPTPQCSDVPCGGSCAICPPCTPGTICPEAPCRLGSCQADAAGACQCLPVKPTPKPTPTPQCSGVPCGGSCAIPAPCTPGSVCPDFVVLGKCELNPFHGCQCQSGQAPPPTPTATPTPCVDTVLCIIGFHWSPEQCQCVPNQPVRPHAPHPPRGPHPAHVPHPPHSPRGSVEQGCLNSGGTVSSGLCCASVGDFPNLCLIGACGCAPGASHAVRVCDCGNAGCFDGMICTGAR